MQIKTKILLVEDDESLGFVVKDNLERAGYEVLFSQDGEVGWDQFMRNNVDLCLLDVMLPIKDGVTLAKDIREKNDKVPIIFISAKSMDEDRIDGLKAGGDDYITKPFNMEELLLKIARFASRNKDQKAVKEKIVKLAENASFDYQNLRISIDGKERLLTQKEADLVKYLIQNANKIIKREDVLMNVWGKEDYFLGRSMDVFMTKIRKYIKDIPTVELQTVHGIGFNFVYKK